jgi:uncharacterized protein YkwD
MSRAIRVAIVVMLAAVTLPVVAPSPARASVATNEQVLLRLINSARAHRGLARLTTRSSLRSAARAHSSEMVRRDYFSHSSASGATFATRILSFGYSRAGCSSWSVSEAIGWGVGMRGTPQAVLRAWLASPLHRSVILGARWRDVGVGCALGTYDGRSGVLMYTVDVGRRTR